MRSYHDEREKVEDAGLRLPVRRRSTSTTTCRATARWSAKWAKAVHPHAAHPAPKGTHFHTTDVPAQTTRKADGFADGIA